MNQFHQYIDLLKLYLLNLAPICEVHGCMGRTFLLQRLYRIIHFQLVSPRRPLPKGAVKMLRQMMTKSVRMPPVYHITYPPVMIAIADTSTV